MSRFSTNHDHDAQDHSAKKEALDEWEEVRRSDVERSTSVGSSDVSDPSPGKSAYKVSIGIAT